MRLSFISSLICRINTLRDSRSKCHKLQRPSEMSRYRIIHVIIYHRVKRALTLENVVHRKFR